MKREILDIIEKLNNKSELINSAKDYNIVTKIIKSEFAEKGNELGLCTAAHGYGEGEWLFDLVWYKMDEKDDQIMTDIPLVLETELSKKDYGGLKEDFDKLLVATSSTKVFVTTMEEIEIKKKYIQKAINSFTKFRNEETLYLIIWDESDEGNFILEEFNRK